MRALALAALAVLAALGRAGAGDATYRNPVLFGDYSDPDAVRAPDGFYLVASSFAAVPGLPILFSPDLVSWRLVGHALARLPSEVYALAPTNDFTGLSVTRTWQHGEGDELVVIRTDEGQPAPSLGSTIHVTPRSDRLHHFDTATGKRMSSV